MNRFEQKRTKRKANEEMQSKVAIVAIGKRKNGRCLEKPLGI